MKRVFAKEISEAIFQLVLKANFVLRKDVLKTLQSAYFQEKDFRAKRMLKILLENASISRREKIPLCQDTGMVVVFVEKGEEVRIVNGSLNEAINKGIRKAYREGYLRSSVCTPLSRVNTQGNTPAVIYTRIVKGDKLRLKLCVKGFGAENRSQIKMFAPTASEKEIKDFILKVVKEAGPDACPPFVVGVGIGGTFDKAAILAKEATLREIRNPKSKIQNKIQRLENELLREINKLNIGPMGLGGETTCLGVNILTFPTHIAGLPVAVNISCHATRSAKKVL
ncbi:MAG: fumarate hydratase [Candidatus Omnitrophica bacterium]|nr:fumarate hydratase [Candidatus Omnitrophota bacterium]